MGDPRPGPPRAGAADFQLTGADFAVCAGALVIGLIDEQLSISRNGLLGDRWAASELVTALAGVVLLFRRRWPLAITVFVLAAHLLAFTPIPFAVMMYTMGTVARRWWQLVLLACVGVAVQALSAIEGLIVDVRAWAYTLTFALGPLVLGYAAGVRQDLVVSLRERAGDLERERDLMARTARRDERARIAREMHDVVAHRVSNIVVTASALRLGPAVADPEVSAEVERIRDEGRAALTELRGILGLLKGAGGEDAPRAPQPTAADLPELVERARQTGRMPVAYDVTGYPELLADPVQRAVYRLVQEALTNAVKHAPGAAVRVSVRCAADGVHAAVENDAPRDPGREQLPSGGHGLIGLSERVALLGGRFDAQPLPGGGFRVSAMIPPVGSVAGSRT
ncbi:sensor histidine kinase [Catellatospora tritici]|uniref:sensor histidine kinase n=1 Tax=Catellatospora tritici TaxID=2851566 RepID=UPI001C2DB78B|nr:sensor histidine kinase [Catellatospora tritici]MBV1851712.1 sensor histidine kinase [Catellatospora tritici]